MDVESLDFLLQGVAAAFLQVVIWVEVWITVTWKQRWRKEFTANSGCNSAIDYVYSARARVIKCFSGV